MPTKTNFFFLAVPYYVHCASWLGLGNVKINASCVVDESAWNHLSFVARQQDTTILSSYAWSMVRKPGVSPCWVFCFLMDLYENKKPAYILAIAIKCQLIQICCCFLLMSLVAFLGLLQEEGRNHICW